MSCRTTVDGEHGLTGGVVRALLKVPPPRGDHRDVVARPMHAAYTTVPTPRGPDPHAREREVLDLAAVIRIAPAFSPAEQAGPRRRSRDARLQIALDAVGHGLTQTLAGAPQLVARWEDAQTASPYAWAVLTAALDAARLGARAPLSADLLRSAAVDYCTSQQQAEAPGNWFEQALAYATEKLHGAVAALSPAGSGMGKVTGYTVADYLTQHASRERHYARVPASTWDALTTISATPPTPPGSPTAPVTGCCTATPSRSIVARSTPATVRRPAADPAAGRARRPGRAHPGTARPGRRRRQGRNRPAGPAAGTARRSDGLRALANAGDEDAAFVRAKLLARRGDLEGLRALADAGSKRAVRQLARLLEERGDLDGLTQVLGARPTLATRTHVWLARLLAERGDLEGLRAPWPRPAQERRPAAGPAAGRARRPGRGRAGTACPGRRRRP